MILKFNQQLKEKDDTIMKLNEIRNSLESEIQELSASLFEVTLNWFKFRCDVAFANQ